MVSTSSRPRFAGLMPKMAVVETCARGYPLGHRRHEQFRWLGIRLVFNHGLSIRRGRDSIRVVREKVFVEDASSRDVGGRLHAVGGSLLRHDAKSFLAGFRKASCCVHED